MPKLRRVVAKGFEEGDLHLLGLCEVGGHQKGFSAAGVETQSIIDEACLRKGEFGSTATHAYMSIWHEAGASQPGGVSPWPTKPPEVHTLHSNQEPQLVDTPWF